MTAAPSAQAVDRSAASGAELYDAACAACHGHDGRGQPRATVGFETELPDFTDCAFTTPEADLDWSAVVHLGGRARALDHRMPAFDEALNDAQIGRIIDHLRGFCAEPGWPRGELNFPRALFTEKAYPENEAVLTVAASRQPAGALENSFLYEHRIGRRAQYEINVPIAAQRVGSSWNRGLGDVSAALKYVLFDDADRGSIVGAGGEVTFPTGKETEGLGGGTTLFEAFVASGHALPSDGFLQFQGGVEVPAHRDLAEPEVFVRSALGRSFFTGRWGRAWTPMAELLVARPLESGASAEWDIAPQMQVSLSALQHVLVSAGVRIPLNERDQRGTAFTAYLLWDWFDGGLFSNWRAH